MTTSTRVAEEMTEAEIKSAAKKMGYYYTRTTICLACKEDIAKIFTDGTTPPWVNATCAMVFKKKNHSDRVACTCGHRDVWKRKFTPVEKPQCKVRGCTSTLTKADTDGLCTKCRNLIATGNNPALWSQHCTANLTKEGCLYYILGGNNDCVRSQCVNYKPAYPNMGTAPPVAPAPIAQMADPVKLCNRINCNNPVPEGRTSVCYTCRPKHQDVVM